VFVISRARHPRAWYSGFNNFLQSAHGVVNRLQRSYAISDRQVREVKIYGKTRHVARTG
jgi:hypothetical protein